MGERNSKTQSIKGSIKGKIILYAALCTVVVIAVTAIINSLVLRDALKTSEYNILITEAESTSEIIDEWLVTQASIIETMKSSLESMDKNDKDGIMDFLQTNLGHNKDALMYIVVLDTMELFFLRIIQLLILTHPQEDGGRMPLRKVN